VGKTCIGEIKASQVLGIRSEVLNAGRSVVTANNVTRTLKLLLGFGVKLGYLEKLPVRIKALRAQKKPRPVLPCSRVQEFLQAVDACTSDPQRRCAIRVALGMGLREGEILHMKHCWVDVEMRLYVVGKAKGKEARTVPIPNWLWESIQALPHVSKEWVFAHPKTKQPHNPNFLRGVLNRVGIAMDLPGLSQHRLRASWASWLAEANVPIPEIAALMGHKHWAVTQQYVVTSLDAKKRAQDNLGQKLGLA
jgi:integrase